MEQYLFIELLWVIPIIGFGVFVSILVFLFHSKFTRDADPELHRRVEDFNSGAHHNADGAHHARRAAEEMEKRLSELEGAIASLTKSIAAHQRSVDNMTAAGVVGENPPELGNMLEAMRREYDAILHENRTLRTQFMKFLADEGKTPKISQPKTNLRIFDDTRSIDALDDTADFEVSVGSAG